MPPTLGRTLERFEARSGTIRQRVQLDRIASELVACSDRLTLAARDDPARALRKTVIDVANRLLAVAEDASPNILVGDPEKNK